MRAMPSPTSSTRPTSRASSLDRYCSISVWRTETISSALNLIIASLDQLVPKSVELSADGGVVLPVADLHNQSAQNLRVNVRHEDRFKAQGLPKVCAPVIALVLGQGHRGAHPDTNAVCPLVGDVAGGDKDRPEQVQPLV